MNKITKIIAYALILSLGHIACAQFTYGVGFISPSDLSLSAGTQDGSLYLASRGAGSIIMQQNNKEIGRWHYNSHGAPQLTMDIVGNQLAWQNNNTAWGSGTAHSYHAYDGKEYLAIGVFLSNIQMPWKNSAFIEWSNDPAIGSSTKPPVPMRFIQTGWIPAGINYGWKSRIRAEYFPDGTLTFFDIDGNPMTTWSQLGGMRVESGDLLVISPTQGSVTVAKTGANASTMVFATDGINTGVYDLSNNRWAWKHEISAQKNTFVNIGVSSIRIKSGVNGKSGTFTLSSGTAFVSNTSITENSIINCSIRISNGVPGNSSPSTVISPGSGFTVSGLQSDNSTYNFVVMEID